MTSRSDLDAAAGRASPEPSQLRLLLLVIEGYAYLALVIGVFVGALALLAWGITARRPFVALTSIFVGLPLLLATASAIRSLFFRIPEPDGVVVPRDTAPDLHRLVEEIRRDVGASPPHRIIVDGSFNASALQLARFGVFLPRNVLVVGYPLFALLSPEHLRAVIAHELGHLSRAHGRIAILVYRLRHSWLRLMDTLWKRGLSPAHVIVLFRWYAPRLRAYSTAVSRRQELLADRMVAQLAGSRVAAETLVAVGAGGTFIETAYWDEIWRRAETEPDPPAPFGTMNPEIWRRHADELERRLPQLLAHPTDSGDTHPSLSDRLASLGQEARLPPVPVQTAADALLGTHASVMAAQLDALWRERWETEWRTRYTSRHERLQRLRELGAVPVPGGEHHHERATILEELEGVESALPHYRAAHEVGHASATLALGRISLDRQDESGVALIERAMDADASLVSEGCGLLVQFFEGRGKLTEAHRYQTRARRHGTREQLASSERNAVTALDRFVPHGLSDVELATILPQLDREPGIVRAALVARELRHSSGRELVLVVVPEGTVRPEHATRLREALVLPKPGKVVVASRFDESLYSAVAAIPGAEVYVRQDHR